MNHHVELRHLRYFACVAEELHFGRAAERLGMAQGPLSHQIRQLETLIGTQLLRRTTRRVTLTPAGIVFLKHAQEVQAALDHGVSHARSMTGEHSGSIVVGGVHIALSHILPPVIAEFRKSYPAVRIDIVPVTTADQLKMLEDGKISVAFVRPTAVAPFMQMAPISREGYVGVLPIEHRLALKNELELSDFADQPMIGYAPIMGANYANMAMLELRKHGVHPMIVQEAAHTLSVITLVAAGVGIAIVPEWASNLHSPYVCCRSIPELGTVVELCVAWPMGETNQIVTAFVETARSLASPNP